MSVKYRDDFKLTRKQLSICVLISILFLALSRSGFGVTSPDQVGRELNIKYEIWIGQRTDGEAGTGRLGDPFDGASQQKFDGIMQRVRPGTHIHILAGKYETRGDAGWQPKDNQWIQGAGPGRTVLKRVRVTGAERDGQPAVIGGGDGSQPVHVCVSDLTLDCNGANIPRGAISRALSLSCIYARIENVEAKNFGHRASGSEMFGFGVTSTTPGRHLVEIRNCFLHNYVSHSDSFNVLSADESVLVIKGTEADQYPKGSQVLLSQVCENTGSSSFSSTVQSVRRVGTNTLVSVRPGPSEGCQNELVTPVRGSTMIFAQGTRGATWEGVISDNYLYFPNDLVTGFGDAGWDGITVSDNTVYGGSLFTFDTFNSANVLFRNNVLHAGSPAGGYCGVVGGGYRWKNWRIVNNQFYLRPIMNQGLVINGNVDNAEITGNWFFAENDSEHLGQIPILNITGRNISLKNNRFDPRLPKIFQGKFDNATGNLYLNNDSGEAISLTPQSR